MPKIVKVRKPEPPDLSKDIISYSITPRSGNTQGSAEKYIYTGSADLKLWVRLNESMEELAKEDLNDVPVLSYSNSPIRSSQPVYNNIMKSALFSTTDSSGATVTFSDVRNVITFGDGTTDSPFSITFWYKRNTKGTNSIDTVLVKGLAQSSYSGDNSEYQVLITASTGNILWQLIDADRNTGVQADRQNRSTAVDTNLTDGNWHHVGLTYDGQIGRAHV